MTGTVGRKEDTARNIPKWYITPLTPKWGEK